MVNVPGNCQMSLTQWTHCQNRATHFAVKNGNAYASYCLFHVSQLVPLWVYHGLKISTRPIATKPLA